MLQQKHHKMKAKLSLNRITTLPQPIIETILCLLPIDAAARTSILSKKWRYKWTTIPKLVFDQDFMESESTKRYPARKLLYAIHHVLLLRQAPIHEFALVLYYRGRDYADSDIDKILLYLARNHTLKKLTITLEKENDYNMPSYVYNGFGSLTSLSLAWLSMDLQAFLRVLSKCSSLKSFSLFMDEENVLDLQPTLVELFQCLPVIEHLTILGGAATLFVPSWLPQPLPPSLIHLKHICLEQMDFGDFHQLAFLVVTIKCSPNLEKIEIENELGIDCDKDETDVLEECSDVWLEHLMELKIKFYMNGKAELEFLKLILARSPKLKKVSILSHNVQKDQESGMLKTLLLAPRVSPVLIDFIP